MRVLLLPDNELSVADRTHHFYRVQRDYPYL